jgi:hypothetical protein
MQQLWIELEILRNFVTRKIRACRLIRRHQGGDSESLPVPYRWCWRV